MSDRNAMGGRGEARDRGEAPRGLVEARERRGSTSKVRPGKGGSGVERTTKKRRKVNHGMEIRPPRLAVVVYFCFPWPRGQVVPLGFSWCYTALLLALSVPFRLCPCSPWWPDGLASCLVLLALFFGEETRGQWHSGPGRSGTMSFVRNAEWEGGSPPLVHPF